MYLDIARRNARSFNATLSRRLGITFGILGVVLALVPALGDIEQRFGLPWMFALRGVKPAPAETVILAINSDSADALNLPEKPSQWSRAIHVRAVDRLRQAGAAVIVFDLFFEESKREDGELATAFAHANNVVLSKKLVAESEAQQSATPSLSQAAALNATFVLPREPVRVDGYWTFKSDEASLATLPVAALQIFARASVPRLAQHVNALRAALGADLQASSSAENSDNIDHSLNGLRQAIAAQPDMLHRAIHHIGQIKDLSEPERRIFHALLRAYGGGPDRFLNFYGPPRAITTIGYDKVAGDALIDPTIFKNKAVFIGYLPTKWRDFDAIRDDYHTVYSQADGLRLSGVEIAATAFANLLEGSDIKPLVTPHQMALFGLWGAIAGIVASLFALRRGAILLTVAGLIYVWWARHIFADSHVWTPLLVPLLVLSPLALIVAALVKYRFAKRQREHVINLAKQFVPADVLNRSLTETVPAGPETQLAYGVCLATDVKNFTQLSESLAPNALANLMNDYFSRLNNIIERHSGTIADLRGDALLALWAKTESSVELRRQACLAALALRDAIDEFNRDTDHPKLETRIGLHAGEVAIGTLGARGGHLEFRAVGDIVNTASRVEGLNKTLNTTLLATGEVTDAIDEIFVRPLGRFRLAGKSQALEIVEIVSNEPASATGARYAHFSAALRNFQTGLLNEAAIEFEKLAQVWKEDGPANFYAMLCRQRLAEQNHSPWDPTVVVNQK